MKQEQDISLDSVTPTLHAGANTESVPSRKAWQRPNITVIDIKRTMLLAGSVTDGVSGSI